MSEKLYHRVPEIMKGEVLMPLSTLKNIYPDLHKKAEEKYEGREELLKDPIATLNCNREDVLFFTAVHPSLIKEALEKCGRLTPYTGEYFEIDPKNLDLNNTTVDAYKNELQTFNPNDLSSYSQIPEETLNYYKEEFKKGENPFIHHKIPQILYKGQLDISNAKKIKI